MAAQKLTLKVDPNRPCSRCDRLLSPRNHHPLDFCTVCQNETGSYQGRADSPGAQEWLRHGSLRQPRCHGCEERFLVLSEHHRCPECEATREHRVANLAKAREAREQAKSVAEPQANVIRLPDPADLSPEYLKSCVAEYVRRMRTALVALDEMQKFEELINA